MAKRGAENQLTQMNQHDDEGDDDVRPQTTREAAWDLTQNMQEYREGPMKEAPKEELERRPIRGLPKSRSKAASPSPFGFGASTPPATTSAFGASGSSFGFGAGTSSSSASTASTSPFGAFAAPNITANGFSFGGSTSAPAAGAFGSSSFSTPFGTQAQPAATASTGSASSDAPIKYYSSLRGLNHSLIAALQKALDADPFVDLGDLLEKSKTSYSRERATIETTWKASGWAGSSAKTNGAAVAPSASASASSPFAAASVWGSQATHAADSPAPAPAPVASKPEVPATSLAPPPPAAFSFGGQTVKDAPKAASFGTSTAGFVPSFTAASTGGNSLFTIPAPSTSTPAASSSEPAPAPAAKEPSPSSAAETKTKQAGSRPGAFPTAAPAKPSPLRFEATEYATDESSAPEDDPTSKKAAATEPATANIFGGSSSASSSGAFGGFKAPTTAFGGSTSAFGVNAFGGGLAGSAASTTKTPAFSFSPSGAFGNVEKSSADGTSPASAPSFSFGGATGGSSAFASKTPGFGFGGATNSAFASGSGAFGGFGASSSAGPSAGPSNISSAVTTRESSIVPSGDDAAEDSASPADFIQPREDVQGEGEEGEETLAENRTAIHAYVDDPDNPGQKKWQNLAVCVIKLKKNTTTGAKRMLARNEANKKVVMNFALHKQLEPTMEKSTLSFTGFEGSNPRLYRVRLKTKELAEELKDAIELAVASL